MLQEEEHISEQVGTARELFPDVVALADGRGAFVWMKMSGRSQAHLRTYAPRREAWSGMLPLASPRYRKAVQEEISSGANPRTARGREAIESRGAPNLPRIAASPEGRVVVSWQESGRVFVQPFTGDYPEMGALRVSPEGVVATGPAHLAADAHGRFLCAWDTEKGMRAVSIDPTGGRPEAGARNVVDLGPGQLLQTRPDPRGGWWILLRDGPQLFLRHLNGEGRPDDESLLVGRGELQGADVMPWAEGLVLALDRRIEGREDGEPRRVVMLRFLGPKGRVADGSEPLQFEPSPHSRGVFLAAEGDRAERMLVAWNDQSGAEDDVHFALLSRSADGPPALASGKRWNSDEASSYQLHGALASDGSRAIFAWEDQRDGRGQVYLRARGIDGWLGDERSVGEAPGETVRQRAEVALQPDGRALVLWMEAPAPRQPYALRGRIFGPGGEPLGEAFDLDPGQTTSGKHAAAAVSLEGGLGFLCTWIRAGTGPVAQRVSLDGKPLGSAWRLSDRQIPEAAHVDLLQLDPKRLVAVWDEPGSARARVLGGRFLGPDAKPLGRELPFEWSSEGGDVDPALAPGLDGGFLMSWTANDGPPRDVFARFYDAQGRPLGPALGISSSRNEQDYSDVTRLADGSWVVVWEDDLSGTDHALARRIAPDGRSLGPPCVLDPWEAETIEVRHAPRVAPLGQGFVALWADHGSGRGIDVAVRTFGPAFDQGLAEPILPEEPVEAPAPPRPARRGR